MKLYAVHDDPTGETDCTERWWMAVWAETEDDAKLIACASYSGDGPLQDPRFKYHWQGFFQAFHVELGDLEAKFAPINPRIEKRPEVLRYAGWSEGDEPRCVGCDLAAFGMEQYKLCECGYCPECGCLPDCPARCNPCDF